MGHMMAGYYFDGIAELVTLGGNIRRSSKSDRHVSTDLTIFSFGKFSFGKAFIYCMMSLLRTYVLVTVGGRCGQHHVCLS